MLEKLERSEAVLIAAVSFFAISGLAGLALSDVPPQVVVDPVIVTHAPAPGDEAPPDAVAWFALVRQHCNPVEVDTFLGWEPAPPTPDGEMYKAACYALSGRVERAREVIDGLPAELRPRAAGVVFEAGHPVADAGDDVAAGPLMELVVAYWPNHYMALYHAGAARFERGDSEEAAGYLRRFLAEYHVDDRWTRSARSMLEKIG